MLVAYIVLLSYLLLTPSPPDAGTSDLVAHAGAFAVLAALVWWNLPAGPWREVVAFGVASLVGAGTEWAQSFVPGRSVEVVDVAADLVGAGMGAMGMGLRR